MRSRNLTWVVTGAFALVAVAVAGIYYSVGGTSPAAASSADDLAALALPPPDPSFAAPTAVQPTNVQPEANTLASELVSIRPMIADTSGPLDRGTASLALWASSHLTWADLKGLPTTSPALFRKDPDQERGRLLCIDGIIQEIRAEKNLGHRLVSDRSASLTERGEEPAALAPAQLGLTLDPDREAGGAARLPIGAADDKEWQVPRGKVFIATVTEPERSAAEQARNKTAPFAVEGIAVQGTGALVDGDSARFCGILTGVAHRSSDGRLLHRAVGMFDLPENTGGASRSPASAVTPAPATSAGK